MSSNVKVSGIPRNVKLGKLIHLFSNILSMRSSDFLLRILPSNGPIKDVLLSLPSYSEAQLAQEKLDNFVFKHNNVTYVFAATMDGSYKQNNKRGRPRSRFLNKNFSQSHKYQYGNRHVEGYNRHKSRSPHFKDASFHLDMQIEILRKQRMILEEERKLLEEQRKLDQLKMKSYNNETSSVANRTYKDVEICGPSSNPSENKFDPKQLTFHQASGVLIRKMNMFINKHSSSEDRKAFLTHLRSLLKQRLAAVVAADGQGVYQTHKVIMLYRLQYPPSEDEEFVKDALKDVREGRCTVNTESVKASDKGANAKIKPDGTKSAAGDHILQEEKAIAKDITISVDTNLCDNIKDKADEKPENKFVEKLLFFRKASGVLIRKMNIHLDKYSPPETRKLLVEYLSFILKKRLSVAVAGQPIYQTHKIIKLYRSQHPVTEDEELIKQLLKDIEEDRVPEDVMINDKEAAINYVPDAEKSAETDNKTSQNNIKEATDELGQPDDKESTNVSKNTDNLEKNMDQIGNALKNQNNKKDDAESNTGNGSIADKTIVKNENEAHNDLISDHIEKDATKSNIHDNYKVDNDMNTHIVVPETTLKCSDIGNINVEEDNRGVKRKNDEVEDNSIKVAKTDEIAVIRSEDKNENKLID